MPLEEIIDHHRAGRFQLAERGYRALLSVRPDHPDALHLLGVALCQQGKRTEALPWIDSAIGRNPGIAAYHAARGEVLRELNRHDEAAVALARALELDPSLASAHNNLGLVHLERGRTAQALASFDEAIRLHPAFITALINRGGALQAVGRWEEAAEQLRRVLELDPDNAWAHTYLCHVLVRLGDPERLDEAAEHGRQALELSPALPQAHNNLGNVYAAMERPDDALAAYRRALELDPGLALPWNNIGRVEQGEGRLDAARAAYERALAVEPRAALYHANLAGLLAEQESNLQALDRYRLALECDPGCPEALDGLAQVLLDLGRREEARAAWQDAHRRYPHAVEPRAGLLRMLAEDGHFDRAIDLARSILADRPGAATAYHWLAMLLGQQMPDDDLIAMSTCRDHPYASQADRASLSFAIGKVLDAQGRYDEAARSFVAASDLRAAALARQGRSFDDDGYKRNVEALIASFTPEFFRSVQGRGSHSRRPIFIVGMPRSGTTLTEQILASHQSVFGAGELEDVANLVRRLAPPFGEPEALALALRGLDAYAFRALAESQVERLEELGGRATHVVDKMPGNLLNLGVIAALWPGATIILCRRHPLDVALSCWTTPFGQIRWSSDLDQIARQLIEHDRLVAHWRAVLPVPMIEVVYEDLVADFEPQARRLVEAVGLPWDPGCLEFHKLERTVRTASLGQVRKPISSRSVGRWKQYQPALTPLIEALARAGHPLPGVLA